MSDKEKFISDAWEKRQEDNEWLQMQRDLAAERGDQATVDKANQAIEENTAVQEKLLSELDDDTEEDEPSQESDVTPMTMAETQSEEKRQTESRVYEKRFRDNRTGLEEAITGSTPEELEENYRKYIENSGN